MYNDIIEIIKTWHSVAQFLLFFGIILAALLTAAFTVHEIAKFFNDTLPILVRGWPPRYKDESEEDD